MKYLLDTHVILWWLFDDPKLSTNAKTLIADSDHSIFVSAASAWEISTKHRLGKLPDVGELLPEMGSWFQRAGFRQLAITVDHAERAGSWPQSHRDPFDRILAAQSSLEALPLVTRDPVLESFDIRIVW